MKFRMQIREVGQTETWWERHENRSVNSKYSAKQAAKLKIDKFNEECPDRWGKRELVSVELVHDIETPQETPKV